MRLKRPTIVCASGGFDPLHVGHVEYLERAKELGEYLVVIVNSDDFLLQKKGYIFMKEAERVKIIESLKCVDAVMVAVDKDLTVCKTLELLKPDVFAKGGDRNVGNIPEKTICDKYHIEIVDGLGEKIQSSSTLVKKAEDKQ